MPESSTTPPAVTRRVKRKKTLRACDYCRSHRIRCEYIAEGNGLCQHCIEYGIECEKVAPPPPDKRRKSVLHSLEDEEERCQGLEPGYLGPSSLTQLVRSSCDGNDEVERKIFEIGWKHDHHWDSMSSKGSGLLIGRDETQVLQDQAERASTFSRLEARLCEELDSMQVLDSLQDTALQNIVSLFPVISSSETVSSNGSSPPVNWWAKYSTWDYNSTPPTPIPRVVRLIHCGLSSLSREVPHEIRHSILRTLHQYLNDGEITRLSGTSTLANAQVLLLLGMNQDLHSYEETSAMSLMWQRVGTGIRMATELAVHRDISRKVVPIAQLHRRWRVWGACVTTDKWLALRLGQMQFINLEECDAPHPFVYPDHFPDEEHVEGSPCFASIHHLSKLSALLGKVLRLVNTPYFLNRTTDADLLEWEREMDMWLGELPKEWAVSKMLQLPQCNDLFNLLIVSVELTFLRAFMFPSSPIPPRITYRPSEDRWPHLVLKSESAIHWMTTPEGCFYLDVWPITVYSLVCCILVQLQQYRATGSLRALAYLDQGNNIVQEWERCAAKGFTTDRTSKRKTAGMVAILRDSAGDSEEATVPMDDILRHLFSRSLDT